MSDTQTYLEENKAAEDNTNTNPSITNNTVENNEISQPSEKNNDIAQTSENNEILQPSENLKTFHEESKNILDLDNSSKYQEQQKLLDEKLKLIEQYLLEISECKNLNLSLETDKFLLQQEIDGLKNEKSSSLALIESLNNQLVELNEKNKKFENVMQDLNTSLESTNELALRSSNENKELQKIIKELNEKLDNNDQNQHKLDDMNKSLQSEIEELKKQKNEVTRHHCEVSDHNLSLQKIIEELRSTINSTITIKNELQEKNIKLEEKAEEQTKLIDLSNKNVNELCEKIQDLEKTIEHLKNSISENSQNFISKDMLLAAETDLKSLQENYILKEKEFTSMESSLKSTINDLNSSISSKNDEINTLNTKLLATEEHMSKEIEMLRIKNTKLSEELALQQKTLDDHLNSHKLFLEHLKQILAKSCNNESNSSNDNEDEQNLKIEEYVIDKIVDHKNTIGKLKNEVSGLTLRLSEMSASIECENKQSFNQLEEHQIKIHQLLIEKNHAEEIALEAKNQIDFVTAELAKKNVEVREKAIIIKSIEEKYESQLSNLHSDINEKESEIQILRNEVQKISQEKLLLSQNLSKDKDSSESEILKLRNEIEHANKQLTTQSQENVSLNGSIQNWKTKFEDLEKNYMIQLQLAQEKNQKGMISLPKEELIKWNKKTEELRNKISTLEIQNKNLENELEEKTRTLDAYKNKSSLNFEGMNNKIEALQSILDQVTIAKVGLEEKNSELSGKLLDSMRNLKQKDLEIEELKNVKKEKFDLERHFTDVKRELAEHKKREENILIEEKLMEKKNEAIEIIINENKDLNNEVASKKHEILQLSANCLGLQNENAELNKKVQFLAGQINKLENELNIVGDEKKKIEINSNDEKVQLEELIHEQEVVAKKLKNEIQQLKQTLSHEVAAKENALLEVQKFKEIKTNTPGNNVPTRRSIPSTEGGKEEKVILEAMSNRISELGEENHNLKKIIETCQKKIKDFENKILAKNTVLTEIVSQIYQKQGPSLQETLEAFQKNELENLKSMKIKSAGELQELIEKLFLDNIRLKRDMNTLASELIKKRQLTNHIINKQHFAILYRYKENCIVQFNNAVIPAAMQFF